MKLIIGLGNPGFRYRNTRHNIGFLTIKEISRRFAIPVKKRRHKGLLGKGVFEGEKITLFMPETFMNLSGEAMREIVRMEKISFGDCLVICDDINLKLGSIRLRKKGSSGGHNGLESIISNLGTSEFPRLRIGIGGEKKVSNMVRFVLNSFNSAERPLLKGVINEALECVMAYLRDGLDKAMTRFNGRQFA
ncbi:MAG: aminoacyl-tRNA hydrolase [Candidatus Omnitrophica bacterium]|nr:aminoacyl-tRNA hydrolase [Candidatus Omnitrophota bacterium]